MHEEHLVYLYCVTAQPPDLDGIQNPFDRLYLVHEAGLCAIASQVSVDEFGATSLRRNLEDLNWIVAETTRHERIVEMVCRDRCAIPFCFATLFTADENLRALLRTHRDEFTSLLGQLNNKAEWGIKAYCEAEKLEDRVCAEDDAISGLNETIRSASSGKAFLLRKKRDALAKTALIDRTDQCALRIVQALREIGLQSRINKVSPSRAVEGHGRMILNSAFLVGHEDTDRFLDAVAALNTRHAEESIAIECSGPWPPYNFCELAKKAVNG